MAKHPFLIISACAWAATLLSAVPASAAPGQPSGPSVRKPVVVVGRATLPDRHYRVPLRVVSYRDLDLTTAEGQQRLDLRVMKAVSSMCGEEGQDDSRVPGDLAECRRIALASARSQADALVAAAETGRMFASADRRR